MVLPTKLVALVLNRRYQIHSFETPSARRVCLYAGRPVERSVSVPDTVDVDQDVPRTAEHLVVPVRRWVDDEPWVLHAAHELTHRDLSLQPRERTAETEVNAAAVAEVRVVLALEVNFIGLREPVRVAVSRGVHHDDRRALRDDRPRNLDVREGGAAGPELDRRLEAQALLDPRHDQLRPA